MKPFFENQVVIYTTAVLALAGLVAASAYSYLLFHCLVEVFSVAVAWVIFVTAWNSRRFMNNHFLLFLGIGYLFVAFLDLMHTLTYKGMGVLPVSDANPPTQLWIAARWLEAATLAIAPAYLGRPVKVANTFYAYLGLTLAALAAIFVFDVFPDCWVSPAGLTPFKKASEWLIALLLALALRRLFRQRQALEPLVFRLLTASIALTIAAELAFTAYAGVYGPSNLAGHVFKLLSFYLVYKAVIEIGLRRPYAVLFRDLKTSEERLREEKSRLEEAVSQVRTLRGLLPICAHCKRIRDDRGDWNQIETYIRQRSLADFTHGICPECLQKLYGPYLEEQ